MTGAKQARQSAVRHPGEQPAPVEELDGVFESRQRAVTGESAVQLPPAPQLR